jgi:hypothetical protein
MFFQQRLLREITKKSDKTTANSTLPVMQADNKHLQKR